VYNLLLPPSLDLCPQRQQHVAHFFRQTGDILRIENDGVATGMRDVDLQPLDLDDS
jgi:hypothetical protein